MENVRRVAFIKDYILSGLVVLLMCGVLSINEPSIGKLNVLEFGVVYIVLLFLQQPTYYAICKLWNPISPFKHETILETTTLRLLSYGLIIIPSAIFFSKGDALISAQGIITLLALMFPISLIWTFMNNFVSLVSRHLKSADFKVWRP